MRAKKIYPTWFVSGALLFYVVLFFLPGIMGIGYSFTDWNAYSTEVNFVGLENYKNIFRANGNYGIFIKNALHGDFGTSFRYGTSAMSVVMEKMPATLQLASVSLLCSILVAIPLGILSAHTKDSPFDVVVSGISSLGRSMPSFWVGIMLILLFGVTLKVLPVSGRGTWLNLVLPCATLTINTATQIVPLVRSGMLEIMQQDYIRTARSKGISNGKVVFKHAFKNALVPVVTIVALQIPNLVGGALITETVFAWPGLGQLVVQSIGSHDMSVVQACVVIIALITMAANLLADLVYCIIDPRIRY